MDEINISIEGFLASLAGSAGLGGILTYLVRLRIDEWRADRRSKKNFRVEDRKRQRELLQEFLGTPLSEFTQLVGGGPSADATWRRERASAVHECVEKNRPAFPPHIQEKLTFLSNIAGMIAAGAGVEITYATTTLDKIDAYKTEIQRYETELTEELSG